MLIDQNRSVLVLVDYQTKLMPLIHEGEATIREALFLAGAARLLDIPVIGTEQNPLRLGSNDARIRAACDQQLEKTHFSAARDGLVATILSARPNASQVILGGCEAHICLLQTALDVKEAGLQPVVVPEACSSRRPADALIAMQRLQQAGVILAPAESVVYEWLLHCKHPAFKEVLKLVKAH